MLARAHLLDDGHIRNHDVVVGTKVGAHSGKHARAQFLILVLHDDFDRESVGIGVDGRVDEIDLALEHFAWIGIGGDIEQHAFVDLGEEAFRDVDEHLHGSDLLDDEDRLSH